MKDYPNIFIDKILRTYLEPFTIKEFARILLKINIKYTIEDCEDYLESSNLVFKINNKLYITRAGAFTDKYFSFKPSRYEVSQKCFVTGSRCLPFIDPGVLPHRINFIYKGEMLDSKIVEFDNVAAVDLFALYGTEFAPQYIESDPSNHDLKLSLQDFELPPKVKLTATSLSKLIKSCRFKFGDRLLCRVVDWDFGIVEVNVIRNKNNMQINEDDIERQNWNNIFERELIKDLDIYGPCSSIEEQLANVFLDNQQELCTPNCNSVEEFMAQSRKISYEPYGVETRLWKKGETVPAVGRWNAIFEGDIDADNIEDESLISDYILDSFIKDNLFNKTFNKKKLLSQIVPECISVPQKDKDLFLLQVTRRYNIIKQSYNWFADFVLGPVRHSALTLYKKVSTLVFEIDSVATNLETYPQQELIILSQIFSHVMRMIEMIEDDMSSASDNISEIQMSLEGMNLNFDEISLVLTDILNAEKRNGFSVVK